MESVRIKSSGYENISVDCPLCNHELVFNRVSDLCTSEPVSGTSISCQECKGRFWVNGDSVNERHEAIILDWYDLLRTKRYMNCILNVCQAYEMFFSLYLRVSLLYVPFGPNVVQDSNALDKLNRLSRDLSSATETFGFAKMRNTVLRLAVEPNRPSVLDEAGSYIGSLSKCNSPKESELKLLADKNVANYLTRIKQTRINVLRNRVIHKQAYRPKRVEADDVVTEARAVLFPLTSLLDLHDDVNWYCNGSRGDISGPPLPRG